MQTSSIEVMKQNWARSGAAARLSEIDQETNHIFKTFPDLRRSAAGGKATSMRKISAAARRAMSAGMRKYWAKRKAAAPKAKIKS